MPEPLRLSIIIPVLDEAACLDQTLARLMAQPQLRQSCEIIISDGGSTDASLEIARRHPCQIVHSSAGRALQMNTAALTARGSHLLFLHADSELPRDFDPRALEGAEWGFFPVRLSGSNPAFRLIENAINLRTRLTRIGGGDQGLFFARRFFDALGGFAQIPLMEDIALSRRARRETAPRIMPAAMTTSSRRWQQRGIIKTVVLMWCLRLAFYCGVDPERLHKIYYPQRG